MSPPTKHTLRKTMRQIRASCKGSFDFIPSGNVLSFASFGSEIDMWPLNQRLAEENRLVLPKVIDKELVLFQVDDISTLRRSKWGILEPTILTPAHTINIALIPGLAFDKNHHRLGYGHGFYDRLLKTLSCLKIGVGYKEQLVDEIPAEAHDRKVDTLLLKERA